MFCGFGEPTERFELLLEVARFVKEAYLKLVRPKFSERSYDALPAFAAECVKYVPNVVLTTVETTLTKEQEAECAAICRRLGATYRIRPWEGGA